MTTTVTATWGGGRRVVRETIDKSVKLTDAPDITWAPRRRTAVRSRNGGTVRPHSITFLYTRTNGGPWQSQITIYAQMPYAPVRSFFPPDEVPDPPQWLTDLIDAAHPDAAAGVA